MHLRLGAQIRLGGDTQWPERGCLLHTQTEARQNLNEMPQAERPGHKGAASRPQSLSVLFQAAAPGRVSALDTLCGVKASRAEGGRLIAVPSEAASPSGHR